VSTSADRVDESNGDDAEGGREGGGSRWKTVGYVVGAVVVLALLYVAGSRLGGYRDAFESWIQGLGVWAPLVFILAYAAGTVVFAPGSVLTLISGAVFGLVWGTVYAWTGATIGACLAFLIARYLARGWVEAKLEDKPRFRELDHSIGRDGGKIVALLRLVPVFPFVLLNYGLGLTKVRFVHYVWACFAMVPGTLLYVYYGHIAGQVLEGSHDPKKWALNAVGLVAVLWVTVVITKKARAVLAAETDLDREELEETSETTGKAEEGEHPGEATDA